MRIPLLVSLLLWILPVTIPFEHANFKCFSSPSYSLHQYVLHEGGDAALRIVVSDRPSHQIVSHIAAILLTEALGYRNVSVASRPASAKKTVNGTHGDQLTEIANLLGGKDVPDFMVDLEVWLPPGLSLDNLGQHSGTVLSAGPLGPVAQYGWFLLNTTTQAFWHYRNETIDHWRYFTNPVVASHFRPVMPSKPSRLAQLLVYKEGSLTAGLMNTTKELIKQRNLLVEPVVRNFSLSWKSLLKHSNFSPEVVKSSNSLLIFTWFPNMITATFPLQRVSFSSPCNLRFTSNGAVYPDLAAGVPCDPYPLFQLTKWIWSGLKTEDSLAYSLFRNMSLTQIQYENLLRRIKDFPLPSSPSKRSELYRNIACGWLKENREVWNRWLPKRPQKVKMVMGGLFPKQTGKWHDSSLMKGAREGIRIANEETLKDYPYEIVMDPYMYNISCGERLDEALYEYNRIVLDKCGQVRGHLLGILAASCSDAIEPMVELSRHYHTVIISPTVESTKYSQSDMYPYIFRTVPDMGMYTPYLKAAFDKMGWKRAALIRKDDHFLNQKFGSPDVKILDDFEKQSPNLAEVSENLKKAKSDPDRARIFVVEHFEEETSMIICAAWKLNMTAQAGFVWFLNPWLRDNFLSQANVMNHYQKLGCKKSEVLQTVERYFVLTHLSHSVLESSGSQYYPYVIDAVLTFAHGLRTFAKNDTLLLSRLDNPKISKLWLKTIRETNFTHNNVQIQFGKGNTRPNKEWILKVYKCNLHNCTAHKAATWKRDSDNTSVEASSFRWEMRMSDIFINGKKPGDGSSEEDNCFWPSLARYLHSCTAATALVVCCGLFFFFILVVCLILFLRSQWRQLKEAQRQLAPFSDILADLAPLEMKQFQIVLNLPLGEGAFGTVRGGEAKINGQWHAVAVKTLHERATQEEKMEFLSEARIMKAFNHPNIVKLLGVRAQSKSEPYMTVMEFLLYGDMKKYLIARHVLAKEEPDHADICPTALTSMTIDIVEGLNYLHGLNFIHRDLALRNCLVSQNRQVKLCDFGLTREVNDQRDYYRFERRGMLPVRWMAPESLHTGVFTLKSDIWSFGVVLYEIVTFGNKPYRDKRNEDVIECMRTGSDCLIRYLNKPEERLPKLLTLMRECFHAHAHERPNASTIIDYLRSDPECVVPCLEEAPPDPGELPAGLLGPDSGDRRRGGNGTGGASNIVTDRIRFHSGPRTSTGCVMGDVSLHAYDGVASSTLAHNSGLNSSFPPAGVAGYGRSASSSGANVTNALAAPAVTAADVRNYASSTEFIRMRSARSLSAGLDDNSPENASPTTGLLETEISMDSEVDGLAACDYDPSAPVFSAFANGTTPHSRGSMVMGSHASLHSRLAHV